MTIYGNDEPEFIAQAIKTDPSLEGDEASKKMIMSILNGGEELDLKLSKENVDEAFFELMCEFLYGRAKMNMIGEENPGDLHNEAVKTVVNIVNSMPIDNFHPEDAREMLDESRGRGTEE